MAQTKLSFRAPGPARPTVWTVSQLVRGANRALEQRFAMLWVEGEVSNLKIAGSGHAFFTLKDEGAALPVAMWRSSVERLRFRLADGQVLRVMGRLGIFAKQGRFQMYAEQAEPAGLGALMLELQQRKERLAAEGLFEPGRKRPLPRWPGVIGVVTSAQGAAVHDIVEVARRRCPSHIVLAPAVVQGPEAPRSLARALTRLQRWPGVSVIIIGRGGGSVEDLWAFNDEQLARGARRQRRPLARLEQLGDA
ncbi:MAG: exodeoxyribonuclease VII large subunit, partial [Nannocystaceae bacterium]